MFFFQMIPYEKINKVTPVLRIIWVKRIFYQVISLCPAFYCVQHFTVSSSIMCQTHYCVQHIIVSNKILCPHLPKGSFVRLSHFNLLQSYHAVLVKHLCFFLYKWIFLFVPPKIVCYKCNASTTWCRH